MAFLIGTDEAGYGPNLGPLVVTATVWQVPENAREGDLYALLSHSVSDDPKDQKKKLQIADSKRLYSRGRGIRLLETNVLAALQIAGHATEAWGSLFANLDPAVCEQIDEVPWYKRYRRELPLAAIDADIRELTKHVADDWSRCDVSLLAVQSKVIFPRRFNQMVDEFGTKGAALSHITLQLVTELVTRFADAPTLISCDKHGGRNRYYSLLQHFFATEAIQVVAEARDASIYRWGSETRHTECQFVAKGERFLPSALASMVSKYLRELAMTAFNEYWQEQVPGIRSTAGYPQDAKRFLREISEHQERLGIAPALLWRKR
ncbi:MAG TPA: hypothetical protein DCY79_05510 [Planctomycetaceae bacterium]|nr:hypothetical protein [Blastopirellula sp.]HAY79247.1 hypothetical protein [Planctomycetaceae bacterium]|tara:strand:- start:1173 stop:2132 length:960 start_codon:yes stop_codon:yes gene_type:complete